jgi:hypothetical protein
MMGVPMAPYSLAEKLRPSQPIQLGEPTSAPVVIVDAPSPLGATAPMLVSLALLGLDARVALTDVGELRPFDRLRRLPSLAEMSGWLRERTGPIGTFDLVGIGLGAIVGLQAVLDGAPIRRVVAVDAPTPSYRASDVLATEQFYGGALAGASRPLQASPTAFGSDPVDLVGPNALVPQVGASWWYRSPGDVPIGGQDRLPAIPDAELARFDRPLLCINSHRSDVVTGGDHVARIVSTSRLVRVRCTDTADDGERRRVASEVQRFLQGPSARF